MPLTGYELFAGDVELSTAEEGHFVALFTSGDRNVQLHITRATLTKLVGLGTIAIAEPARDNVKSFPVDGGEAGH